MHLTSAHAVMDLVGIGIGPANLSLAALLRPHPQIKGRFFDKRSEFQWHSGLMLPQAALQVPYLKDLVSLVDPTNELSFLSFLVKHKRLLCFINANFPQVLRREFNQYYRWACEQIPDLQFDSDIESVDIEGGLLVVKGSGGTQATRNLVLGTGQQPSVPACAKPWLGATLLHASQYLLNNNPVQGKRVVVVGGGQTGAEVFQHLISDTDAMPASVAWVSRRWNFFPLDESSFTNELYTPEYSDYFYGLPEARRRQLLAEQKLASDGISPSLLESIYRRVYELRNVLGHPCDLHLQPGRELVDVTRNKGGWALELTHAHSGIHEALDADIVVLCTGYDYGMPTFLDPIAGRIDTNEGEFVVNEDYSIRWDSPQGCRIYVQNAARSQRGIADPNLGLIPWRCARIINSVAQRTVYDVEVPASFVSWDTRSHSGREASPGLRMAS
ncbi:SidA/IucD/PvdA family monooxygenase [Paraburkholderia sp. MMS20-SJTR3]|uniref:SidA/IucD/PvdA family monooxygenase n=2 Tax=Paraburkholderia sejongensis TaxID=2886946 RepID=A0ABS8K4I7_9BURK|nr:SidA/IucD/PvdA family monooxygenase [Paraburkholderia sp. MMS20-SJTR3]